MPNNRYESLQKRMILPRKKPRYGAKSLVDSGTRDRTISRYNRLKAMGVDPGVSQGQLDTGAGARAIKDALRGARAKKRPATTEPVRGKGGRAPRGTPYPMPMYEGDGRRRPAPKRKPSYGGGAVFGG